MDYFHAYLEASERIKEIISLIGNDSQNLELNNQLEKAKKDLELVKLDIKRTLNDIPEKEITISSKEGWPVTFSLTVYQNILVNGVMVE